MYKIGEFSKMAQVTTKMLKYYEQCGLIEPQFTEPDSGYRYYGVEQIVPVSKIRVYIDMGFSTAEIKEMLCLEDNAVFFDSKLKKLEYELAENRRKAALLTFYKEAAKNREFNQKYRVIVKTVEKRLTASKRLTIPDIYGLADYWCEHYNKVKEAGGKIAPFPNSLTCFHDKEYILCENDIELMLFIDKTGEESVEFEYKPLEAFRAVSVLHNGKYEFLNEAYAFAYRWICENGYEVSGDPMENYLKSVYNTSNENEYITEILIPIKEDKKTAPRLAERNEGGEQ